MDKKAIISQRIMWELNTNGGDLAKAIDTVIGKGTYDKLVSDVYEAFNQHPNKTDLAVLN